MRQLFVAVLLMGIVVPAAFAQLPHDVGARRGRSVLCQLELDAPADDNTSEQHQQQRKMFWKAD